jgi:dTDP-glucose 4,6-dehydratase
MAKRILITGAGGFAGAHFLEHILVNTDWEITLTDSFRHKGKTDRIRQVLANGPHPRLPASGLEYAPWADRVEIYKHDLTVPVSNQGLDFIGGVDYMVCYASESHVDRSITDPVPFVRNNVDVALSSLEMARALNPSHVVWISTDEVCGPVAADDFYGHDEWGRMLPSNPYAGSKAAQEAIAVSYWRTYGVPLIITRCMNMIGERQDPEKFIPMAIAKISRGETVTIHGTPDNIGTRHYLHSRNLADGILFLLKTQPAAVFPAHLTATYAQHGVPNRVSDMPDMYNVASPARINNLTLAQMIAEAQGKPLHMKFEDFHTTRPGHDPHYGLNPRKIHDLGWRMPMSFEESLTHTVNWTLKHPEWLIPD